MHKQRTIMPNQDRVHAKWAVLSDETRKPELYPERTNLPHQVRQRDLRRPRLHLEWAELSNHSRLHLQRTELCNHARCNLLRTELPNVPGDYLRRSEVPDRQSKRHLCTHRLYAKWTELSDLVWTGRLYV